MTKYRAKVDVPPGIKAGDVVEFSEPLVEGFKNQFELADSSEDITQHEEGVDDEGGDRSKIIGNPDRNALKARAAELKIDFAPNIPTDRLVELVKAAEEEAKAEEAKSEE